MRNEGDTGALCLPCRWRLLLSRCCTLLVLALAVFPSVGLAQTDSKPIRWTEETSTLRAVGKHIAYFEDPSGKLTLEQARSQLDRFTVSQRANLNWAFTESVYWCTLELENQTADPIILYLGTGYGFYDSLNMFVVRQDETVSTLETGDTMSFDERPIPHRSFVLPVALKPTERARVFLRFDAREALVLNLDIYDDESLRAELQADTLATGIIYGVLVVMALYNFCLLIWTRDYLYLHYTLYALSSGAVGFALMGLAFQYLWPGWPVWHNVSVPLLSIINVVLSCQFFRIYLNTGEEDSEKVDNLLKWLMTFAAIMLPLHFMFPLALSAVLATVLILLMALSGLIAAVKRALDRYPPAYYFLAAFSVLLGMMAYWMLAAFDVVGVGHGITSRSRSLEFSFVGQITLLAFGLASRINQMREERLHLQESTLWFQEKARANLEKEVERQTAELRDKTEKLKEMDEQKTTFFQNISHELRTPLTLILNPLEEEAHRNPQNDNVSVAMKNSRRLLRLVNQLLDFQKLSADKRSLQMQTIDLVRFIGVCSEYFASSCVRKHITFTTRVGDKSDGEEDSEAAGVYILAEVDALEKVVFNYLSNALKYTPDGGKIGLGLARRDKHVVIYVRDSGPGIPKESQHKLFEVFSQVDDSSTREHEGTGLGLALVKKLVEAMGGKVGIDSEEGEGALFWALFPETEVEDVGNVTTSFRVRDWSLDGAGGVSEEGGSTGIYESLSAEDARAELILVVDDLADMRQLISRTLSKEGYSVITASNGARAFEKAMLEYPDLIVTDWMMPVKTGPDLIEMVRGEEALSSTPTVLLTAKTDEESRLIGTSIGADAFLGKPFNAEELLSTVRNLLQLKAKEKQVSELNRHITENVLKRYLPPTLIEQILDGTISMEDEAKMLTVTVVFSDLTGFTNLSETLGPEKISLVLNEYLTRMNQIIFAHEGTVDKFIGDAIMVIFGAPQDMSHEEQVRRAAACGREMQLAMADLNRHWLAEGIPVLKMRIGIHRGPAVVGNFGSEQRSDYTAIGPTVNLASRIETACTPGQVYVSECVREILSEDEVISAGSHQLKGVAGDVSLYSLKLTGSTRDS